MNATILLALATVGLVLTGLAATAVKAFQEFSRRELEQYCQRRKHLARFGEILDDYEEVAVGAESLQIVGIVLSVFAGCLWLHEILFAVGRVGVVQFIVVGVSATLILLASKAWIPAALARLWSAPVLYHTWPLWQVIDRLLRPLTWGMSLCDSLLRRLADRPKDEEDEEEAFEEEIRSIVTEGLHDGLLEEEEREMIEGVIELGDETVSHIMTPRSHVDAFDVNSSWANVLDFAVEAGRTRFPVFEHDRDNIVGVLYVKDLLRELSPDRLPPKTSLKELLRKPWFVPTTKPLDEMLQEFLQTRQHLAIVVDEYRAVAGVVTIEDVLEEIVGEIVDESDKDEEEFIKRLSDDSAEVLGVAHVDLVNEHLGLDLPEPEECDTIAGLVITRLGRIPKTGDTMVANGARVTVLDATRRRVERLRIENVAAAPAAGQANR